MEPLESRQLLSVAIEMGIHQAGAPAYVLDGSTVNASPGDMFTVDLYGTLPGGDVNDTLSGYTLNLVGTDASISLDQWARNTTLFPDNTANDTFGFYDDVVADFRVNAGLLDTPLTTTVMTTSGSITGWLLGSLDITLPNAVGSYLLNLSITDNDNPTNITHQLTPALVQTTPIINNLTFNLVSAPTATIASVSSLTNATISNLDVTFTNINPTTVALADFTLTRGGANVNLVTAGVTLTDAGDANDQTYQLAGLSGINALGTDGDYVLTLGQANVANLAGVTLASDAQVVFTIDRTAPATTVDVLSTDDRTPQLTGTIIDVDTAATVFVTVTHTVTAATQTFTATNNASGIWTLADNALSELLGGIYDVKVVATDALGNASDVTTNGALTILDVYDNVNPDDDTSANAVALSTTFQRDLSIHTVGDVDWKSFTLTSTSTVLVRAIIPNGEVLKVELFTAADPNTALETFVSASGSISEITTTSYGAGNYLIKITEDGSNAVVTDYDLIAGDASLLAQVEGRHLFYNNSFYDGNNAAANSNDDAAIATDKSALLPGGTATAANVSSYSKGINGIMIDVLGLTPGVSLDVANDFSFRVGNDSTPSQWSAAAAPTSISVTAGVGVNSSDRITIIWADGAITKTWVEVQLLATANTGLAEADVFYFGNAIGEAMNSVTNLSVNATDQILARVNPASALNRALVDNLYDFNRDSLINATDQILARSNGTSALTALKFIVVPLVVQAPPVMAGNQVQAPSMLAMALASVSSNLTLTVIQVDNQADADPLPTNGVARYLV